MFVFAAVSIAFGWMLGTESSGSAANATLEKHFGRDSWKGRDGIK